MERLESLINSLKNNFENGAEKSKLLDLIDQMRFELTRDKVASDHTMVPISVLLPKGFQPVFPAPTEKGIEPPKADTYESGQALHLNNFGEQLSHSALNSEVKNIQREIATPGSQGNNSSTKFLNSVPRPPAVIVEEPETVEQEELISTMVSEEKKLDIDKHTVSGSTIFNSDHFEISGNEFDKSETIPFEHFHFGLQKNHILNQELEEENPFMPTDFLKREEKTLVQVTKAKELHEILANRVVAKAESPGMQAKELADALSTTKISDLRKAIGINDRFRFIKSLFKDDESLFDLSVKTINNFNILPEAEYWIKRELLIKLGWNEEDELVRQFYQLVNRRFL